MACLPTASQAHLLQNLFSPLHILSVSSHLGREGCCLHSADIEGGVHRRVVAQGVHGPAETVPSSCDSLSTHSYWPLPKPGCVFISHSPSVVEEQDGPFSVTAGLSRNWQGSDSSLVTQGHLGWAREEPGAHGPSNYPFLSLAVFLPEQ